MFRKVRFQLTFLFVLVTSLLLAVLLVVSFSLSANSQLSVRISAFTSQSFTVAEDIRDQNILTAEWLNTREETAGFHIYLWDNDVPLFHNTIHKDAFEYSLRPTAGSADILIGYHGLLPRVLLYDRQIAKNGSILQLYFLQPLDSLYTYLWRSLLVYLFLFILSTGLLSGFCWYFTGRLLAPLLASQKSQNRFISAVSHELRTPLAVILANASACEKASYGKQKPFFQVIAREGEQMSTMLEQLLTLSKADSYGLELQVEKTDLQTLLLEIYENFLPVASESGHHLYIRLPEAEIPLCECDPIRIREVCHILLHNAISYTPLESNVTLFIKEGGSEKEIGIGVEDDGEGIPETEREKIFERFYRASDKKGHHGLGLTVAKEIAVAHKGSLTVSSVPGGGACFLLKLPVRFEGSQSGSFKINL